MNDDQRMALAVVGFSLIASLAVALAVLPCLL